MLTKTDLEQMREVVREEIENEARAIKDELGSDIRMSRIRIDESIDGLKNRVKNLEIQIAKMNKEDVEEEGFITKTSLDELLYFADA